MHVKKLMIAVGFAVFSSAALAADFEEGYEAANSADFKKAAAIWQNLAEQGNAEAQFNLAMAYHSDSAGQFNEKEAVKWYHKAAISGHPQAQEYLVVGYREGWYGLQKNESKANFWEQKLDQ